MTTLLLRLARSPLAALLLGWLFAHMSFLLPVRRLRETETLVAFHHPQPAYPTHILLVPKRPYRDMMALETADTAFLSDLFQTVQSLVQELNLTAGGYRLIGNGGSFQDVPHLHFHLIADSVSDTVADTQTHLTQTEQPHE